MPAIHPLISVYRIKQTIVCVCEEFEFLLNHDMGESESIIVGIGFDF